MHTSSIISRLLDLKYQRRSSIKIIDSFSFSLLMLCSVVSFLHYVAYYASNEGKLTIINTWSALLLKTTNC